MQNTPTLITDARRPRGIVRVTGAGYTNAVPGWLEWEVENNNHYRADTFRVKFSLKGLPAQLNAAWWASQQEIFIEIFGGFPVNPDSFSINELASWMYGRVDEIDYNVTENTVSVSGRDLSAQLIDTNSTQKFQNLTSSQIATQIAASHGLLTVDANSKATISTTNKKAGKFYTIDKARMMHKMSDWDLLTWLAQEEGFVVYVRAKVLYFQPKPDTSSAPYVLAYQAPTTSNAAPIANVKTITFARNLTLARDVIVKVKSWNVRTNKAFISTATGKHVNGSPGTPQTYSVTIPNLTPEKAQQKAQALLAEITAHEVRMNAAMPADNILDVNSIIRVDGTGTQFDQLYYPDSITRSMSVNEGYAMRINAKNHSTESMVVA